MSTSTLTLKSSSSTFTHWNMLNPDLVKAGCSKYRITTVLTTIYRFKLLTYFLNIQCMNVQIRLYKIIRFIGNIDIKNILNIVAFGANPFISLS